MTSTTNDIDWMECEGVRAVRFRGTRILPDAMVNRYELLEGFPALPVVQIQQLIDFAHSRRGHFSQ